MILKELKKPYESIISSCKDDFGNCSCEQIVSFLLSESSVYKINLYTSILLVRAWHILQNMYYSSNNARLSCEECYDIFIHSFYYVVYHHVWDRPESTLYGDDSAFLKALSVASQSRKVNYICAKFKKKRVVNNNIITFGDVTEIINSNELVYLEEFGKDNFEDIINERISYYANQGCILTAIILEGILYNNLFDDNDDFDVRKLRKYLRNIDDNFCKSFSKRYHIEYDYLVNNVNFKDYSFQEFDKKIKTSFITLKCDDIIKLMLDM